jgi:hypothetical protein
MKQSQLPITDIRDFFSAVVTDAREPERPPQ